MEVLTGKIPYPPTVNSYWITRSIKNKQSGKIIKTVTRSEKVKKYHEDVFYLLKSQNIKSLLTQKLRLDLHVFPPDHKKRDLDNVCKAILDALQHAGIYDDDFKIWKLTVERKEVRKYGEVEFVITSIGDL